MCEPYHSIVQYDGRNDNDDNLPFSGQMDTEQRLMAGLGAKVMSWGKKIRDWFHFSKLGSGHHKAIELVGRKSLYLPIETRYEGVWWDRTFQVDGYYHGPIVDESTAIQSAKEYHEEVVMGSMSKFRRFFELSIRKSDWAYLYVTRFFENVLTSRGRDEVLRKLRTVFERTATVHSLFAPNVAEAERARATDVVMGFTRKRSLFLPHWADNSKLWLPGQGG